MTGSFTNYGMVDPYVKMQYKNMTRGRKRCLVIVVSSIILVVAIVCLTALRVTHGRTHSKSSEIHENARISQGSNVIQAACQNTMFPQACLRELSSYPGASTATPQLLVVISMKISLQLVTDAFNLAKNLIAEKGNSILDIRAVQDCLELMDGAKDHLCCSISRLSDMNLSDSASYNKTMSEINVCMSSLMGYQTACSDGLELAAGCASQSMIPKEEELNEMAINAFCLLATLAKNGQNLFSWKKALPSVSNFHHRRLLSREKSFEDDRGGSQAGSLSMVEDLPDWLSVADRKLLQAPTSSIAVDATVAQDGSGDYTTIQEALDNVSNNGNNRYVIYIKGGIYEEIIIIPKTLINLTFLGDGINVTIITGSRNVAIDDYTTYQSSTVGISAPGFLARDITFRNTAGPEGHQAVAVRAGADQVVFDNCSFESYQDTLYALSGRQFYRGCMIYGTVDYIFGNAIAVFQKCQLLARQPLQGQQNTYTAQGRKVASDISGYSFQDCDLVAAPDLAESSYQVLTYLGRPWKAYSRTVFMQSFMDSLIDPAGWLEWNSSNPFTDTLYYGEYENRGDGSNTDQRVDWAGVHPVMTLDEATQFTVENFISGAEWLPATNVEFDAGLYS